MLIFIITSFTLKFPTNFLVEFNNNKAITKDDTDVAIAIPSTPMYLDKIILKSIFITTPIIPLMVVSFVFFIENNEEFKISLIPAKGSCKEYPSNAIEVKITALESNFPLS